MINNLKLKNDLDLDEFLKNIKDAREIKKVSIEQASQTLHIEKNIIERLEAGEFDKIDIDVFILGHIRSYLNWIGIDPKLLTNNNKTEDINLNQKNNKISSPFSSKIIKFYISKIALISFKIIKFYLSKIPLLSFKISKFYISIIAIIVLTLFILILIIFDNRNNIEIKKDSNNNKVVNYENLITTDKNDNQTQEISEAKIYSNEEDDLEENNIKSKEILENIEEEKILESEELIQILKDEKIIDSEELIQNLKEEKIVDSEELIQNLNEENKIEYSNINESIIVKGDTIIGLLKNLKWNIKDAMEAAEIFSTIYDPKKINAGMTIIFPKNINIKSFAISINKETSVMIKIENKNFKAEKLSLEKAREIISSLIEVSEN
jgi:cytoskeletal protein RodZ